MKLKNIFIALIGALCGPVAWAQTGQFLSTDNVLPSSMVNQVYQDRYGRIWIATDEGLCTYDGYQCRTFRHEEGRPSLKSDHVNCLLQATDGTFYIGTDQGVQAADSEYRIKDIAYVREAGDTLPSYYVTCLIQRRDGSIWAGTSGWGVMRVVSDHAGTDQGTVARDMYLITAMAEDKNGVLWVVTTGSGVAACKGDDTRLYLNDEDIAATLQDVCIDARGHIFVASSEGVYRYDRKRDRFDLIPETQGLNVVRITPSQNGTLLIGTNGDGLFLLNERLTPFAYYSNEVDVSRGKVYSILEDRAGNLWLGLLQKGVFMQPVYKSGFRYLGFRQGEGNPIGSCCVMATYSAPDGTLYVGTDGDGLFAVDAQGRLLRHYDRVPRTILCVTQTPDGRLWAGSYGDGCGEVDLQTGEYRRLDFSSASSANIFGMDVDRNGDLWVGTMGCGVVRYHPQTGTHERFRSLRNNDDAEHSDCLCNDFTYAVRATADGNRIYVCTTGGLSCYDLQTDSWLTAFGRNHILDDEKVECVLPLDGGRSLWIGATTGLYHYTADGQLTKFGLADGLPSTDIKGISQGGDDELWVSTSHGLSRLLTREMRFVNYFAGDGLQANEFMRNAYTGNRQQLVFGGTGGLTLFAPSDISQAEQKLNVYLSEMYIGNVSVSTETKSGWWHVTKEPIMKTSRISLAHADNTFSLFFTSLVYGQGERIRFQYSINGGDWQTLEGGRNELAFNHLGTGTYRFRVRATDGRSVSDLREFTIRVRPLWYLSPLAILSYLLLLGLAIWLYLRWWKKNVKP